MGRDRIGIRYDSPSGVGALERNHSAIRGKRVTTAIRPQTSAATTLIVVGDVPAGVHVARYIPQDQVLPHCAAVMSHAGSGTFLASLGFGLPQVCIPLAADQFLNAGAGAAARAGVGVVVPPDDRSLERITAALTQTLQDDLMCKNAAAVRAEIDAMPSPAEVAELLAQRFG